MPSEAEIEAKFWKALKSDRTMMLGLDGVADGHARPMTAVRTEEAEAAGTGPIWFFTTKTNTLVEELREGHRATAHFASKGHDVFASIHGRLIAETDRVMVDKLWNPFVDAWFKKGKEDPELQLLRLETERAQIWLDEHSLFAGVKILLGHDPKKDYKDKVADVSLG